MTDVVEPDAVTQVEDEDVTVAPAGTPVDELGDAQSRTRQQDAVTQVEDEERDDKPWSVRARIRSFFYDWPGAAARQWPLILVIGAFCVGLALIYFDYWRRGSFIVGGAVGLAGFLRLVLPERLVGLLAVRSKALDVCFAVGAGALIMVLSLAVVPY
ncbi:MAG: DUF3017 domain-containing protein [Propionibacteriaceae bacterium]|jgi:hypothetical protein|nr:DUF3017 domain-containing protein [Propionibacteriaceae bacterium]